jgi:hypothetical protein
MKEKQEVHEKQSIDNDSNSKTKLGVKSTWESNLLDSSQGNNYDSIKNIEKMKKTYHSRYRNSDSKDATGISIYLIKFR